MSPVLRGKRPRDRAAPAGGLDAAGQGSEASADPVLELFEAQIVMFSDPAAHERVWIGRVLSSLRDTFLVQMVDERSAREIPGRVDGATAVDSAFVTFSTRVVRRVGPWVTLATPERVSRSNRRSLFRVPVAFPIGVAPASGGRDAAGGGPDGGGQRDGGGVAGTTLDIGHGGVRALLPEALAVGGPVTLRIDLGHGATMRAAAATTWSTPHGDRHATGLRFVSISNEDNKRLTRAVGQLQRRLVPRVETVRSGSCTLAGSSTARPVSLVELSPGAVTMVTVDPVGLGTTVTLLFFVTGRRYSLAGTTVDCSPAGERHRVVVALDPLRPDTEASLRAGLDDLEEQEEEAADLGSGLAPPGAPR